MDFVGKLHDYSHTFESTREFFKVSSEKGLRAALEWRDGKFGDDYRNLSKTATEKGTDFDFPQALSMPEVKEALEKFEAERKSRES